MKAIAIIAIMLIIALTVIPVSAIASKDEQKYDSVIKASDRDRNSNDPISVNTRDSSDRDRNSNDPISVNTRDSPDRDRATTQSPIDPTIIVIGIGIAVISANRIRKSTW